MSRFRWLALGVVTVLAATGCTGGGPAAGEAADAAAPVAFADQDFEDDLPPEQLLEAPPRTENERLLRRAQQTRPFCVVMVALDNLEEPEPGDLDQGLRYGQAYYNIVFALDPQSRVNDPEAIGGRRRMPLPAQIVQAVEVQRIHMFAHVRRLQHLHFLLDRGEIDEAVVAERLDDAFLRLAVSEYTSADRVLTDFAQRACVVG